MAPEVPTASIKVSVLGRHRLLATIKGSSELEAHDKTGDGTDLALHLITPGKKTKKLTGSVTVLGKKPGSKPSPSTAKWKVTPPTGPSPRIVKISADSSETFKTFRKLSALLPSGLVELVEGKGFRKDLGKNTLTAFLPSPPKGNEQAKVSFLIETLVGGKKKTVVLQDAFQFTD